MAADAQRSAVYAAELAAFDGTDLERVVGVDALTAAVRSLVEGPWWPGGPVDVVAARRDARSSVTRCAVEPGATPEIRLAAPQATLATAAHELAHVVAGVAAGHDAAFRRAHLDVVAALTGADRAAGRGDLHVRQLADAYAAAGLAVGERRWPPPPAPAGPIAL